MQTSAAVPLICMRRFAVAKCSAMLVSKDSTRLSFSLPTVAVRYVNTYSRTQLYLTLNIFKSLQQGHVSAVYVGHHRVVVGLTTEAILACV